MSRTGLLNIGGLVAALVTAVLLARPAAQRSRSAAPEDDPAARAAARRVPLPEGGFGVLDRSGVVVPIRPYRRIVSTSLLTDRLLVALCEPDRVLAFSATGAKTSPWRHQYAGKAVAEGLGPVEAIIALKPDLVLMNSFGSLGRVTKLRAAGVQVFELGELRGMSSLLPVALDLGELLGQPELARQFTHTLERRMQNVDATLGDRRRKTALYVAAIGPKLFGGTVRTSYHDVLTAAGLIDVAAARYKDWTAYSSEQLVELAPEILVTKQGMTSVLCSHPGLERLRACHTPGGVVELPPGLLDEPGPSMLDAAEMLFEKVYGR